MNDITLWQGDCLELMNGLSSSGLKSDAVITDPPYNISRKNNDERNILSERIFRDSQSYRIL